jgi:hypothetical protein
MDVEQEIEHIKEAVLELADAIEWGEHCNMRAVIEQILSGLDNMESAAKTQ